VAVTSAGAIASLAVSVTASASTEELTDAVASATGASITAVVAGIEIVSLKVVDAVSAWAESTPQNTDRTVKLRDKELSLKSFTITPPRCFRPQKVLNLYL
jgi:hypothetical protein